jgi:hypothetical protein
MSIPGFTGDASLYRPSRSYQSVRARVDSNRDKRVVPQIRVGGIGIGGIGGQRLGFWCELGCDTAYAFCMAGCGALSGPVAGACIAVCTSLWRSCNNACD